MVFECVHRLLEKGYQPKHIELEKRWSLGHSQKSGRADITVFRDDEKNKIFSIIECKTAGQEYTKALKILNDDGGQLFSYWQQDGSTQCLALYASDFENGKVSFKNAVLRCKDDENLTKQAKKDETILLYQNAKNAEALHNVWKETYNGLLLDHLLFSENAKAYDLDNAPLRKRDLKEFDPNDKIINKFEEILRHNAVSDKENAFNRLIALFICKLADESTKGEDDEVEFQYKIGESYENLQDRLQRLYQLGMDKFMKEEIFYVPNDYADKLFRDINIGNRQHTKNTLEETIRKLKFYTNNDFAFKDVHNEELFYQNGKIVVEMVQLFEQYRLVHPNKHQFLGDLFEQLLNKGFKQNEGQFFTPSPITRFIWDCLPLQNILAKQDGYPKIIDYACGSGHFLTEAVEAINATKPAESNDWARESIYGIEKDYRLARVSKVSMFMNGVGESNIIFGDGLDNAKEKGIENDKFDILVANPPYSVSAFKSHLKLKDNQLALLDFISNNGGEIEVLFCERIAQLLKSGGVGAVILPSSILSNDSGSYTAARTLLLNEFHLRAIVNFGSKTFGATGTNTAVLFLEKRSSPPKDSALTEDNANALFGDEKFEQIKDREIYTAYLKHIGLSQAVYDRLRRQTIDWETLQELDDEYLATQRNAILSQIKLTKTQEKQSIAEQQAEKLKQFFAKFAESEKARIALFALLYNQQTLIINAPSDNAKQKAFLGYDWSNRKGAEGIQILNEGGELYNAKNRFAENTLASLVRSSFGNNTAVSDTQKEYAYWLNSVDMIDFSGVNFNRAVRTSVQKKVEIRSKYPLVNLEDIAEIISGQSPESEFYNEKNDGLPFYQGKKDFGHIYLNAIPTFTSKITKRAIKNDILMSVRAPVGDVNINPFDEICIGRGLAAIRVNEQVRQQYLFAFIRSHKDLFQGNKGMAFDSISRKDLAIKKIPLPPLDIQQEICKKCEEIDRLYENSRMKIEEYREKIAEIFNRLEIVRGGINFIHLEMFASLILV